MPPAAQPLRQRLKETAASALLDAAETTLIEKGFDKATMNDVAACAGCAVGTLYVHFKNKDELFRAIIQRRRAEIESELATAMGKVADPIGKLRVYIELHVRWAHANVAFVNMMCSAMPMRYYDFEARMKELMPECKDNMNEMLIEIIRQAQKGGSIRKDIAAATIAEVLHGVMVTLLDQFSGRPEKFSLKEQLTLAWQFIASGVTGEKSRG